MGKNFLFFGQSEGFWKPCGGLGGVGKQRVKDHPKPQSLECKERRTKGREMFGGGGKRRALGLGVDQVGEGGGSRPVGSAQCWGGFAFPVGQGRVGGFGGCMRRRPVRERPVGAR